MNRKKIPAGGPGKRKNLSSRIPLPPHLDRLVERPWSPTANAAIDRWLWYLQVEEVQP